MVHVLTRGGNVGLAQAGLTGPVVVTLTWTDTAAGNVAERES